MDDPPAVSVEELSKTYGDGDEAVSAADGVSFEIERGSIVGILGPNGAGKTTTIKSVLGAVSPDGGSVRIDGVDTAENPVEAHKRMGAILEGARNVYWRLTVRENLKFFAGLGGENPADLEDRHTDLLRRFDLLDKADTVVRELSRGMKQKVSLATTLARDVSVVFMDEPTLGLDLEASVELQAELKRLAADSDVTIVMSSHNMDVIENVCDSVVLLQDGEVLRHEDVTELVDAAEQKRYQLHMPETADAAVESQLEQLTQVDCTQEGDELIAEVDADDSSRLYEVMDLLQRRSQEINDIHSNDPDLESVFLSLTESESQPAVHDAAVGD